MTDLITRDVVVTRVFDASSEQVERAWSDPQQIMRWWGPDHFTAPFARMDFREGGTSLVCMRSPDGQDMWMSWRYTNITPGKRFEFVQNLADENGNRIDPASVGLPPEFPRDVHTVVALEPRGNGRTEMTITETTTTSAFLLEMSRQGLEQTIDKMGATFLD